ERLDAYLTHDDVPGEARVLLRRGSLTLMHHALWHRVERNSSDVTRCNLYLGYSPSWLHASDRVTTDAAWAATLPRTARIVMRPYEDPYDFAKPPAADVPLFLPRAEDPPRPVLRSPEGTVPDDLARQPLPVERFLRDPPG